LKAIICGTGASLDKPAYWWSDRPKIRIGLNEAAEVVPGCTFCAFGDCKALGMNPELENYAAGTMTTQRVIDFLSDRGVELKRNPAIMNGYRWTIESVTMWAIDQGIKIIEYVGCDGDFSSVFYKKYLRHISYLEGDTWYEGGLDNCYSHHSYSARYYLSATITKSVCHRIHFFL